LATGFAIAVCAAQTAAPQTAEQVYKNITVLKGTPADQLTAAMQFISSSLGVDCAFCHVQGKMEADDKPAKKTARQMMEMTNEINKASFRGQRQVTCFSCHHGQSHPANTPPVLESDGTPPPAPAALPAVDPPPTVDSILDRYIAAAGGADALNKASTRVMTGKISTGAGESPIEVITKAPNRRVSITQMGSGSSYTAFDGNAGWMGSSGRPAREMSPAESAAAGLDAEFALPLRIKEMYPQLRRGRPERIGDLECEVLNGSAPGRPAVRLYFDRKTGLLMRMVRYTDTPVGRNPTQIDYADYREAGGVKIPFRWTLARPNGRFTIQIAEVKADVPVDDARFEKPTGAVK
jgi:hypothetical protein